MRPVGWPICWGCIMIEPAGMFDPMAAGRLDGHADRRSPAGAERAWRPIVPVPDDTPRMIPRHRLGVPSAVWDYRDAAGHLLGRVCRWDHGGDKTIRPLTYCEDDAGCRAWRWLQLPAPRPMYLLDRLALRPSAPVLLVEGEKTADAAAKLFFDHAVVTSSSGSNASDQADWSPLSDRRVVIWPDHDEAGSFYASNVARLAFEAGASSVRIVEVPAFWPVGWDLADALPDRVTIDMVRAMVAAAKPAEAEASQHVEIVHQRPAEPIPLVRPLPPAKPYPIDALGPNLADVAGAIQEIVQSPPAMCANSVLAVVTLAAQPQIDIELPIGNGAVRPVSSLFLTVGKSGERKSGTDDLAMRAVKGHEARLRTSWELDAKAHKLAHDAWEAERRSILGSGRSKKGNKIDRAGREADLCALGDEPLAPLAPIMTMAEPTIEGLAKLLLTGQPSVGIFSAEGGQFVGGHAMFDDAKLRSAAALSHLWDGEPWKRVRSLDGPHTIANRRLAMHLMVQPDVAAQLVNDPVLRDQGLVSRLLVTYPTSTMGTRFYKEPSAGALALVAQFTAHTAAALSVDMPLQPGTRNELAPRTIRLSPEARADWVRFSDRVERMLAPGGQLEPNQHERAAAARVVDHRARRPSAPRYKVSPDKDQIRIEPDHAEPGMALSLICDTFGTGDGYFADGLLAQIANVARTGKDLTTRELNVMVAMVHAIEPRNPVEALLAAQMAAVHEATMVAARRLNHIGTIEQQNSASNMLNKLARTFTTQMEALKRYRSTGEQNVRVTHQHVSVPANQAVVGINQGGGGDDENPGQSHAPCRVDEYGPALLGHEQAISVPLPGAGREGVECLPNARGAIRGAER